MNDADFLQALEDCSLDKVHFDHRGHLRAAWLYLEKYPFEEAATRCGNAIRRYAGHLGATGKYHVTLTRAFMYIIADLRRSHPADDWQSFIAACPDLVTRPKALVARHYSEEVLGSDKARTGFIEPDRESLPRA